tara:strand:- start:5141 stop:6034 length:894 start_codon:yes stop_codon:yes gene_type:complete
MKYLAPIVLFTYNRLNLLKLCINSLKKNELSKYSKLYIYSDGPKNSNDKIRIKKVRKYLKNINGFKKKVIVLRKNNFGLTRNIVDGVTNTIKKEKNIIVLEDDLIVSKYFLKFMNEALNKYKKQKEIWHISGWNYNLEIDIHEDSYFTRGMNCWGWATWHDRWKHFEKKPKKIVSTWNKKKIKGFNFDNSINFYSQILRNYNNKLDSWAIFWYASIYSNKKLCLNPTKSLTQNIGVSSRATNTKSVEKTFNSKLTKKNYKNFIFPTELRENQQIYNYIKKQSNLNKVKNALRKIMNF